MGNLIQNTIFGRAKYTANTFIGGVAASLNTPALVAVKLGIASNRIKVFKIIGNDIEFAVIGGTYAIPNSTFDGDTNITYFDDQSGLVSSTRSDSFNNTPNLQYVKIKNATSLGLRTFQNSAIRGTDNDFSSVTTLVNAVFNLLLSPVTTVINLPALTTITGIANFATTNANSNNITFNVPLALKTSNSGNPNPQLTANCNATIINYIGWIDDTSYNTAVGNMGNTFTNKGLIGRALGVGSGGIVNVQNVEGESRFKMYSNYSINGTNFSGNTNITYYNDIAGFVTTIPANFSFSNTPNLQYVKIRNATLLGGAVFQNSGIRGINNDFSSVTTLVGNVFVGLLVSTVTVINLPSLTTISGSSNFIVNATTSNNATFNVPLSFKTSNSGKPHLQLSVYNNATIINYIGWIDDNSYNTAIGNMGAIYTNKGLAAKDIGIGSGGIVNLQNIGGDIRCKVLDNYTIPNSAYLNNNSISYFDDSIAGLCINIGTNSFYGSRIQSIKLFGVVSYSNINGISNNANLNNVEMPNMVTFAGSGLGASSPNLLNVAFPSCTKVTANKAFAPAQFNNLDLSNCTQLGPTTGQDDVFLNVKIGMTIKVKSLLQTVNAGTPDGDLVYAANSRGANIVYV